MKKKFLETGKIVNTHGIRGEVKIQPWSNTPSFLCRFKVLYINEKPYKVLSARVHKGCVVVSFDGISDFDSANALREKIVFIDRDDAKLDRGEYFIQDLIDIDVIDFNTEESVGKIKDIINMPAQNIYVVDAGREILVPAVPEFIREVNIDAGYIKINFIEGM